jgi:N utilization substance protein B
MLSEAATPTAVVIDEAIEIARKYGSGESSRFINGILDTIGRRLPCEAGVLRGPNALGP